MPVWLSGVEQAASPAKDAMLAMVRREIMKALKK